MRVLVTGGSGIVGSYLRRALAPAHRLTCFSRTAPAEPWDAWIGGDIMDTDGLRQACAGQDAVIHLAAVPGPGRAAPAELLTLNVIGTVNVLEAAVACGVERVVLASSAATTGFSFQTHDIVPALPADRRGTTRTPRRTSTGSASCWPRPPASATPIAMASRRSACGSTTTGASTAPAPRSRCAAVRAGVRHDPRAALGRALPARDPEPDGVWPTPGPPPPRNLLWAVTDLRDAAATFGLALAATDLRHEVFLIAGTDTCSLIPTPELLDRHFPDVERRAPLAGFDSPFSSAKAVELLGYRPRSGWRGSDFDAWLQAQPEEPKA